MKADTQSGHNLHNKQLSRKSFSGHHDNYNTKTVYQPNIRYYMCLLNLKKVIVSSVHLSPGYKKTGFDIAATI